MKSAIEEMLFNNRGSFDYLKNSEEASALHEKELTAESALLEKLPEEVLALFETYQNAFLDCVTQDTVEFYKEGFRFGFLLALDILGG